MSRNKDKTTTFGLPSRLSQACTSIFSSIQAVMSSGSKLWRASAACTRNQDKSESNVSLTHGKANKRERERRTYLGERLHLGSQGLLFCLPKSLRLSHTLRQRQDLLVKLRSDNGAQARSVSTRETSRRGERRTSCNSAWSRAYSASYSGRLNDAVIAAGVIFSDNLQAPIYTLVSRFSDRREGRAGREKEGELTPTRPLAPLWALVDLPSERASAGPQSATTSCPHPCWPPPASDEPCPAQHPSRNEEKTGVNWLKDQGSAPPPAAGQKDRTHQGPRLELLAELEEGRLRLFRVELAVPRERLHEVVVPVSSQQACRSFNPQSKRQGQVRVPPSCQTAQGANLRPLVGTLLDGCLEGLEQVVVPSRVVLYRFRDRLGRELGRGRDRLLAERVWDLRHHPGRDRMRRDRRVSDMLNETVDVRTRLKGGC